MEVPAGLESSPIGQKLLHGASMEPTNVGSCGKSQILSLTFLPSMRPVYIYAVIKSHDVM